MGYRIPKCGRLDLRDGELVEVLDDGSTRGRIYVGLETLVVEREVTFYQEDDPPKLRLASSVAPLWRCALGFLSWNLVRADGKQEELALLGSSVAEDAIAVGDLRGQLYAMVRGAGDREPRLVWMTSDAYTPETHGVRQIVTWVREAMRGLGKFA